MSIVPQLFFRVVVLAAVIIGLSGEARSQRSDEAAEARRLLTSDPRTALNFARAEERRLAMSPPSPERVRGIAQANWLAGAALVSLASPDAALVAIQKGLDGGILRIEPQSKLVADLFMAQANALAWRFNVEAALRADQRAFRIYDMLGDRRSQALALSNIGSIYMIARDNSRALQYYAEAIDRFPSDNSLLLAAHFNRGQTFIQMGDSRAARREFGKCVDVARELKSSLVEQRCLGNLAYAHLLSSDLDGAAASLKSGYALEGNAEQRRDFLDWIAAAIALRQGRIKQATNLIGDVFAKVDLNTTTLAQREGLRTAYEVYKAAGEDTKALTYLEAYKQADDKARSIAASASSALMSARFDYVNQQAQINQLHTNQVAQAAAAREKLRNTVLIAVVGASGIVFALLLFGYISIRRSRDQVRAANDDLSTSNIALEKALAARTEFLAMTSHEIRTPLNGILGMTQVLLADRALAEPVRGKIELVHGAGETMKSLVDDLLDVAKMTNGEIVIHKADMNLARLLRDAGQVWSAQAENRGLRLALEIGDAPERIVEDEVRFRQIVFNLMSNAIKFTDRGEVRLTASVTDAGAGQRLRLAITDSGIGIPAGQLGEIFESFRQVDSGVTRRHGGTGLGLAICRSLARAMGGDVTVTSTIGAGSTFLVDLPLDRVAVPDAPPREATTATTLAEAHVLLVEANPISQSVMRSVLGPHVAAVATAANADEAERLLDAEPIAIVLADGASLGLDMNKAAALAHAVAGKDGGRLALLWPTPDEAIRAAATQAGAALLIAKPISAVDLVAAIKSLYTAPAPEEIAA